MIYRDNDLDKANEFITCPGSRYENIYDSKVQKDGSVELEIVGQKDIQQEIDSWIEHTDMAYILRSMAQGTYQPKSNPQYGDFTSVPQTMQEAMQLMIDAERSFLALDLDTRARFDNDFKKWLVALQNDEKDWSMRMWPDKFIEEEVKEEVKSDDA